MRSETILLLSTILGGVLVGVFNFKCLRKPYVVLLILLVITFIAEALAEYSAHRYGTNLLVYHMFHPVEYSLLAGVYYYLLENRIVKVIIIASICIYTPLSLFNSFFVQRFSDGEINSYAILMSSILIVFYALELLLEYLRKPVYENIYVNSSVWLSIGVILFFATNIFFWGYYSRLADNERGINIFYKILFYENIVFYGLCGLTLLLTRFKSHHQLHSK